MGLNKKWLSGGVLPALLALAPLAQGKETIEVVGSSTVYPFTTVAAERFAQITGNRAPKVESTGSGGGMKLFCAGIGADKPDITNASRRMKKSEQQHCDKNGVTDVIEVKIGYDGIVVAQSLSGQAFALTRRELFLALAKQVPDADNNLVDNPHTTWQAVNPALPATEIRVFGPPPSSGTRDAFAELVLEQGCQTFAQLKALKKSDKNRYKAVCHGVREDGKYVEAGENDNIIIQKLSNEPDALGVFGFSFLEESRDKVRGLAIDGQPPLFDSIADGSYPVSRPLFFYVKSAHLEQTDNLGSFIDFFVSEEVMGEDGFLVDRGLIPLPLSEYEQLVGDVTNRANMPRL